MFHLLKLLLWVDWSMVTGNSGNNQNANTNKMINNNTINSNNNNHRLDYTSQHKYGATCQYPAAGVLEEAIQ